MIVWTRITWYSKLLAAIFFIFLFPALTFFLGKEYAYTEQVLREQPLPLVENGEEVVGGVLSDSLATNRSGIMGMALSENHNPYLGAIEVFQEETLVTTTAVREDGKFLLFLEPGEYTLVAQEDFLEPLTILVERDHISRVTLSP